MTEPEIKTPWNTPMDPDELRDYYDRLQDSLDRECDLESCEGTTEYPRRYCSSRCRNIAIRKAAARLEGRLTEES